MESHVTHPANYYNEFMKAMAEQELNDKRAEEEEKNKKKESEYTFSEVEILEEGDPIGLGYQWIFTPYRTYMKLGPYANYNGRLVPGNKDKQGFAYLSVRDLENLEQRVSNWNLVGKNLPNFFQVAFNEEKL
jgi:hypothetical protein